MCGQSNEKQNEYFSRKRRVDVKIVEKQPTLQSYILYHFLLGVVLVLGWQFSQISSHDSVTAPTTFLGLPKVLLVVSCKVSIRMDTIFLNVTSIVSTKCFEIYFSTSLKKCMTYIETNVLFFYEMFLISTRVKDE